MAVGLQLWARGNGAILERTFPRPPFFVGREFPSQCVLEDAAVSKMHCCIDVREGAVCVRDVGSLNGTFVRGTRIPANEWVVVGPVDQPAAIRIAAWDVRIQAITVDEPAPSVSSSTLASMLESTAGHIVDAADAPKTVANVTGTMAVPEMQYAKHVGTFDLRSTVAQVGGLYGGAVAAMGTLHAATARQLESAPEGARVYVCQALAASYPLMTKDPSFVALFRHYGWAPTDSTPPPSPLGNAALAGLQELARWYLGDERVLSSDADVIAFKDRLRSTLDELLLGYVPLATGLDRFERELALRQGNESATTPAALAKRLLDWRTASDQALRKVRESFADLMMHQVALVNGLMRGVKALLTELAPSTIEKAAQRRHGRTFFLFRWLRRLDPWGVYKERHADLSDEENERFRLLFGPEFAAEYQQFTREVRALEPPPGTSGVHPSTAPPPPVSPPYGTAQPIRAGGQRPSKSATR